MNRETRIEIVRHACRWACNIITEVMHNHASAIPSEMTADIRAAISSLQSAGGREER